MATIEEYTTANGKSYYYNRITNQSSWEKPLAFMTDQSPFHKEMPTLEDTLSRSQELLRFVTANADQIATNFHSRMASLSTEQKAKLKSDLDKISANLETQRRSLADYITATSLIPTPDPTPAPYQFAPRTVFLPAPTTTHRFQTPSVVAHTKLPPSVVHARPLPSTSPSILYVKPPLALGFAMGTSNTVVQTTSQGKGNYHPCCSYGRGVQFMSPYPSYNIDGVYWAIIGYEERLLAPLIEGDGGRREWRPPWQPPCRTVETAPNAVVRLEWRPPWCPQDRFLGWEY